MLDRSRKKIYIYICTQPQQHDFKIHSIDSTVSDSVVFKARLYQYWQSRGRMVKWVTRRSASARTRRLRSACGRSPCRAEAAPLRSARDGWRPWWPPGCRACSRRRRPWPPTPSPPSTLRPPACSTHGSCTATKGEGTATVVGHAGNNMKAP